MSRAGRSTQALEPPAGLAERLRPLWVELAAAVSPNIGPAGLEALAAALYLLRGAQSAIEKDGLIVVDAKGTAVAHPAIQIERLAGDEIRRWTEKYGQAGGAF